MLHKLHQNTEEVTKLNMKVWKTVISGIFSELSGFQCKFLKRCKRINDRPNLKKYCETLNS